MKTLLIPVDFSASSDNAVAYAADLANDREFKEIILAANLYVSIFERVIPSPDLIQVSEADIQRRKKILMQQLEELKLKALKKLNPDIIVRTIISELPLLRSILEQVLKDDPYLVLIGSNSYSTTEDSAIGRHIVELAKVISVPVLIIPPQSNYRHVVQALVVHRSSQRGEPSGETKAALSSLHNGIKYQFYNLNDRDSLQGVIGVADDKDVQLIIALPGKHSFLYKLTHQNILHGLSMDSRKPVLILK
jgi:nucleotide-binding universal stress UspA family protein